MSSDETNSVAYITTVLFMFYDNKYKILAAWLCVNLFLPMFLPALILYAYSISQGLNESFYSIFLKLMDCGIFVFSSFTLTFSLFEDYQTAKRVVTPIHYLAIGTMLIFLIFMYLANNPLFEFHHAVHLSGTSTYYVFIFISLILLNGYLKYRMLESKRF